MQQIDQKDRREPGAGEPRQPYEKPGIAWEEDLGNRENLAYACGKLDAFDPQCQSVLNS